jgi:Cu/Ag efflux pump CusA
MTALATALALVPLAINGEAAGNEIQSPMAVVILGGLLTSTFLNLFVVPAVCTLVTFPPDDAEAGA